jgi:SAM-dependent methyltransferase
MEFGTHDTMKSTIKQALPIPVLNTLRRALRTMKNLRSRKSVFRSIYHTNTWEDPNSLSGPGSSFEGAQHIRAQLPSLVERNGFRSILDIPCGDLFWIRDILPNTIDYIGADIVPELIERNREKAASMGRFEVLDLVKSPLPASDLALVRDCLIHLPNKQVIQALRNIKASEISYVLTTTYESVDHNVDIDVGGYRPINLRLPPFNLPPPLEMISDTTNPQKDLGKSMGLWRTSDIL